MAISQKCPDVEMCEPNSGSNTPIFWEIAQIYPITSAGRRAVCAIADHFSCVESGQKGVGVDYSLVQSEPTQNIRCYGLTTAHADEECDVEESMASNKNLEGVTRFAQVSMLKAY